jgi:hypothetical protein
MVDKYLYDRRPTGFYIPRYRNLFGESATTSAASAIRAAPIETAGLAP